MAADTQANKWIDRSTTAACAMLVVAICYVFVNALFLLLDDQYGAQAPTLYSASAPVGSNESSSQLADVDPTAIPLWNLFGKEGVRTEVVETPQDVTAPVTNLQLELHGVFVALKEENSTAIISEKRRDSKLYKVGDKLPGRATLAAVHADRVLLSRQGKLEALYFPEGKSTGSASNRSTRTSSRATKKDASSRRTTKSDRIRTERRSAAVQSSNRVENMIQTASNPADFAESLQQELNADPQAVLQEMGLEPNPGGGYKITGSNPMFASVGGRKGDVIRSVNGVSFTGNPATDLGDNMELLSPDNCNIEVEMDRNGNRFTNKMSLCP